MHARTKSSFFFKKKSHFDVQTFSWILQRKNSTGGDVNNGANTRTDHTAAVKEDSAAYGNDEEISRPLLGPAYACFSCIADDDANKFIGC